MFGWSSDDVLLLPRRIYGRSQNSARIKKTTFFWQVHILSVYFFTIIITKIVNSFWCEKAVFYTSFGKTNSIKQNQLRLPFNLWWKNFDDDVENRKHEVSFPNLILVASLFIVVRLIHLPTFIFVWNDQNIPSIILSMQISAIFELMLFKNK